jgi:hypothetical protein
MDLNIFLLVLSILALAISVYVFYRYSLTLSDSLFSLGLSMGTISIAIFCGYLNVVHLGDVTLNVGWIWYAGTSSALCFMFLNSIVASSEQLRLLKSWQIIATILFLVLLLLTPTFPPFPNALTPALLNLARPFFCALAFCRYVMLYISKETRFCLVMSIAFLALGVGFAMITPQLLDPSLVIVTIVGASLRILGYSTLLFAYVGTK